MKKITSLAIVIIMALAVNAQVNNWVINGSAWEKDITPEILKFSEMSTAEVQANILAVGGGANPNPYINSGSGEDLTNGYFAVSGGQVGGATQTEGVRQGFNIVEETLESYSGKSLRFAATQATIEDGTKSAVAGFFNLNWYIPLKYDYTGYTVGFEAEAYNPSGANLSFIVYDEGGNQLGTTQSMVTSGWNDVSFTQTANRPFRFKMSIPNPNTLITYFKQPKIFLISESKPEVREIAVSTNGGGTVVAEFDEVLDQDVQVFSITPDAGNFVKSVTYNNEVVTESLVDGKFTTPSLTADANLEVEFDLGTAVDTNTDLSVEIVQDNGVLSLLGLNGESVTVYTVSGQLVKSFTASASVERFELARGFYLVKIENSVTKISVN